MTLFLLLSSLKSGLYVVVVGFFCQCNVCNSIYHGVNCKLKLFTFPIELVFLISFQLLEHLPHLFTCLQHPYTAVRHMAARCTGVFSKIAMLETMNSFLERVLPWLAAIDDCTKQEGAIEALACILN